MFFVDRCEDTVSISTEEPDLLAAVLEFYGVEKVYIHLVFYCFIVPCVYITTCRFLTAAHLESRGGGSLQGIRTTVPSHPFEHMSMVRSLVYL